MVFLWWRVFDIVFFGGVSKQQEWQGNAGEADLKEGAIGNQDFEERMGRP